MKLSASLKGRRDERIRYELIPVRLVTSNGGRDLEKLLRPGSGQPTIWTTPGAFLKHGGFLLLDFGREIHGGVRLIAGRFSPNDRPWPVRIRFGESVTEACGEPDNDHAVHDSTVLLARMGATEFGNTGFRFVRIDNLADRDLELREITAKFEFRDLEYRGSFESDDPLINEIYRVSAYTVQLCMQEFLWDGAKRDRLIWLGDMHPEIMTIDTVFGGCDIVERSLNLMRDETLLPKYMNGMITYSIWYLIIMHDHYMERGDRDFLRSHRDYIFALLELLCPQINPDGSENLQGGRVLDWGTLHDPVSLRNGIHCLFAWGMRKSEELARFLDSEKHAELCHRTWERLASWSMPDDNGKSANALRVLAGFADASEVNRTKFQPDPYRNLSTFHGYYVLLARAQAGDIDGCLELLRHYWGGMLSLGATTFWEHFDMDWLDNAGRIDEMVPAGRRDVHADCGESCFAGIRNSFCHGWASGPAPFLARHVLGVKIETPGCRTVRIEPKIGNLKTVRGTYPTPYGPLEIEISRRTDGTVHWDCQSPKEIRILCKKNETKEKPL